MTMRRLRRLRRLFRWVLVIMLGSCTKEVPDENKNVYSFTVSVGRAVEGSDIPVRLSFVDAGLTVDNAAWGNPWEGSLFSGHVYDASGREVTNVLFSGADGVMGDGSPVTIGKARRLDLVMSHLRRGAYMLCVDMETRYTVPTHASVSFNVYDSDEYAKKVEVPVNDFTVPDGSCGVDIDALGNVVLDLRYFNDSHPFRFISTVRPGNASDKQLEASSEDLSVVEASVEGETAIVLSPKNVGKAQITVRARSGKAVRRFGVTVIRTAPLTEGFTLPTDNEGGDSRAELDLAGRLALDINDFLNQDGSQKRGPYEFICAPVPADAAAPVLTATSGNEDVVVASVVGGNKLRLEPRSVGYATVAVSTVDGIITRALRVAVCSKVDIVMTAEESSPSEEDDRCKVFPCIIRITPSSKYLPSRVKLHMYGKVIGRIDLTDPKDYFLVEELKNSRTAIFEYEKETDILIVGPSTPSGYDVYTNLMKRMAAQAVPFRHSDDYPNYYNGYKYYQLYSVILEPSFSESFDTNLYRLTLVNAYDRQDTRIYQYLH